MRQLIIVALIIQCVACGWVGALSSLLLTPEVLAAQLSRSPSGSADPPASAARVKSAMQAIPDVQQTKAAARDTKSVIVLSLRTTAQSQRCSNALLHAQLFTGPSSVKAFFLENSYGRVSIDGTVFGPYVISVGQTCDYEGWGIQADAAATAAGVKLSAYDVRIYVLPSETASMASVCPGRAGYTNRTQVWIRADGCDSEFLYAHELGHCFGAGHAGTPGSRYGDLSSVMGGIFDGLVDEKTYARVFDTTAHFTAPQKIELGWLAPANIQTVTESGRHRVALLEDSRTDVQVLKIVAGRRTYYCSYRRAVGFDSSLLAQYVDRTSIHIADDDGASALYGTLGDGESYDAVDFTVTQTSHDTTAAYLTVTFHSPKTPTTAHAQKLPPPLIRAVATIQNVEIGEAVRLPNGRNVLYTHDDRIMAYDVRSKRATLLTRGFYEGLTISRGGDHIAYVASQSSDAERSGVWIMPIHPRTGTAKGRPYRIGHGAASWPIFSPGGEHIAFRVNRSTGDSDLVVLPTGGGDGRTLATFHKEFRPVAWTADGQSILVQVGGRGDASLLVERVPVTGGERKLLLSFSPTSPFANISGQIDGQIALYRADIAARAEGRLAYVTASGEQGEFMIPPGSPAFVRSERTLLTQPSEATNTTIYELDLGGIRRRLRKR